MKFTKMHGLGNDYVYVNCVPGSGAAHEEQIQQPDQVARVISDRFTGIGSDGLILICPSERADARMEMYNADGSRAQMCGNGIRCVAKYVVDHRIAGGPEVSIDTDAGIKSVSCRMHDGRVQAVRVDMGEPSMQPSSMPCTIESDAIEDYPLNVNGQEYRVTCVSMGNPHVVVFVDDLEEVDLAVLGPAFERHEIFPERTNTHFVRVDSRTHVTMRTWERGSGATQACGTGACGVAVAGAVTGRTDRSVVATLPGGDLELEWSDDNRVYMTGPAVEVFSGVWNVR